MHTVNFTSFRWSLWRFDLKDIFRIIQRQIIFTKSQVW